MDEFGGRCRLDWWANPLTCLASVEVSVGARWTGNGCDATGTLVDGADLEGFELLCALDPVFRLRIGGDDVVDVLVELLDEHGRFTLTEYDGPASRAVSIELSTTAAESAAGRSR
ncbi:hypothetical protein F4553_000496 [Allocatelliglobosispora scoriae]|uniref:Uncharacterized protein n=1 Tax=Allocatelliglobosispora scoriae TaxID=643052 RepID=A0A841BDD6_9ACTN|nr:hypothetical protein [Allocatelliglobosispora scoriae]MBB5867117.1 hypothetical protein [Allocatelliglobosispora scoriae]